MSRDTHGGLHVDDACPSGRMVDSIQPLSPRTCERAAFHGQKDLAGVTEGTAR